MQKMGSNWEQWKGETVGSGGEGSCAKACGERKGQVLVMYSLHGTLLQVTETLTVKASNTDCVCKFAAVWTNRADRKAAEHKGQTNVPCVFLGLGRHQIWGLARGGGGDRGAQAINGLQLA